MICFSITSVLWHRGMPWRGCAHTQMNIHTFLLSCVVNYSCLSCPYTNPTASDKAAIIKLLLFCFFFFYSRLHNMKMIKRVVEAIPEGATSALKSTEIEEEQESIEILFCNIAYVVWYINPPPTLCRSKQILCLLLVVSPQQYFYLSCKTAIQIDEVQQHDIFCTSITLRGLATWVKSQQTITFPDISSPHSDRWWILPDKAFIIAENRECTKISSLFFYPPSAASLSKSRWTQLQEAEWLHAHRREGKSSESLQDTHWQSKSISLLQGSYYGAAGRGAYQTETTVLCQLRFDPAKLRGCNGNELWWHAIED